MMFKFLGCIIVPSIWKVFNISFMRSLLVTNPLIFCLFEKKSLCFLHIWRIISLEYRLLGWHFFLSILNILFHYLFVFVIAEENSSVILILFPLYIVFFFPPLASFQILWCLSCLLFSGSDLDSIINFVEILSHYCVTYFIYSFLFSFSFWYSHYICVISFLIIPLEYSF